MSASVGASPYSVQRGDAIRDADAVLAIWRGNLGQEDRIAAKYQWFYRRCPWGAPLVELLHHAPSDSFVGVAAAGPRRMIHGSEEWIAGVLVDMAVSGEHRSLGPALMLQKALLAGGSERFSLVYGFPNPKAAAVFARVGYTRLGDMIRYARVLRFAPYLARRMPRPIASVVALAPDVAGRVSTWTGAGDARSLEATWSEHVDPRVDDLWRRSAPGNNTMAIRDTAMLRWRFDEAPNRRTRYLWLAEPRGGALRAWFACEPDESLLHVRDYWAEGAAEGLDRQYIERLAAEARSAGHAALSVECFGAHATSWTSTGFVERSRRPVFGRWYAPGSAETLTSRLHLTSADEDE